MLRLNITPLKKNVTIYKVWVIGGLFSSLYTMLSSLSVSSISSTARELVKSMLLP